MTSPPNDRSRPQAAPESFGGDTHIIPQATPTPATDAPSWDDLTNAWSDGWITGYAHGLRDAAEERDAQALHARAAEVVLNAAKDLHVADLRRSA